MSRQALSLANVIPQTKVADWQLDQECDDVLLNEISKHIVDYQSYGPKLGVLDADIETMERDLRIAYDIKKITAAVFKLWHKNKEEKATYRALAEVAIKLRDGTGARKICQICAEGVQKEDTEETDGSRSEPHPKSPAKVEEARPENQDASAQPKQALQQFCTESEEKEDQKEDGFDVPDAAPGSARRHLLWDIYNFRELRVHFLNPDFLKREKWTYGGDDQLSTSHILDWATSGWNRHGQKYPILVNEKARIQDAQIRVLFSNSCTSWSKVGKAATWVASNNDPTMVLNLSRMTGSEQRSMVIHEFGHALGLDHEHQRSDFWDVLGEKYEDGEERFIIGEERMRSGDNRNCLKACPAIFRADLAAPLGDDKSDYDENSIMHYWFDKNWLQTQWRDLRFVLRSRELTPLQKSVLQGVHARDYHNGQLPDCPSQIDYETLNKAYSPQWKK